MNFYANGNNPFFASESLCVPNFEGSRKDEGGKLMNNASIDSKVVGLRLECTLLDILNEKCLGKFVENDFENQVEACFKMSRTNHCEILKAILRKCLLSKRGIRDYGA
ncbi:hypothetical protein M9H77_12806 [Catharanthus roseus]|uniref:Uncharacterized protein n=1 Tax=Catharanthus roseus TaxID=4058 RepID=A0ACC0BIG7_CATRO|nr:hypothetical protein M9H77_12806 [Catharanthus roseus]